MAKASLAVIIDMKLTKLLGRPFVLAAFVSPGATEVDESAREKLRNGLSCWAAEQFPSLESLDDEAIIELIRSVLTTAAEQRLFGFTVQQAEEVYIEVTRGQEEGVTCPDCLVVTSKANFCPYCGCLLNTRLEGIAVVQGACSLGWSRTSGFNLHDRQLLDTLWLDELTGTVVGVLEDVLAPNTGFSAAAPVHQGLLWQSTPLRY